MRPCCYEWGRLLSSYSLYQDVSGTSSGHDNNCRNKDVSLPYKLWVPQYVRHGFPPFSPTLSVFDDCFSSQDSPHFVRCQGPMGAPLAPSRSTELRWLCTRALSSMWSQGYRQANMVCTPVRADNCMTNPMDLLLTAMWRAAGTAWEK